MEGVFWRGRTSGSFATNVFLWTVCISVVPDGFWTRRRSEAFVGDDGLYGTAAFVSEGPSPWWPSWTFLLSKRWGYTCCCAGVFLPLYQGMTITSTLLWLFCLNAVKVGIFCHQLNLQNKWPIRAYALLAGFVWLWGHHCMFKLIELLKSESRNVPFKLCKSIKLAFNHRNSLISRIVER